MVKVKSGNLDKLGPLYERHKGRLYGFFHQMGVNTDLCEDLVQIVFMRILKYRHSYSGEGTFVAWMFSIARNVGHDHYTKSKESRKWFEVGPMEHKIGNVGDIEQKMDDMNNGMILKKALMALDPEKREILILSKIKEVRFSEIGNILGCSEGAAKVKAHRALKELRMIFQKMEQN